MAKHRGGEALMEYRRWPSRFLVSIALALAGCVSEASPAVPDDDPVLVQGREVYITSCANCHGTAGAGGRGSKLDDGRVTELYPYPADQVSVVTAGVRAMPAFEAKLAPDEIEAVVRYTREILSSP